MGRGEAVRTEPPVGAWAGAPVTGEGVVAPASPEVLVAHAAQAVGAAAWLFWEQGPAGTFDLVASFTASQLGGGVAPPGVGADVGTLVATGACGRGGRPVLRADLPPHNSWCADGGTLVACPIEVRSGSTAVPAGVTRGALVLGWPSGSMPTSLAVARVASLVTLLEAACLGSGDRGSLDEESNILDNRGSTELRRDQAALAGIADVERRLDEALTTPEALTTIIRLCAELTGKGVCLVDGGGAILAAHPAAASIGGATGARSGGSTDEIAAVVAAIAPPSRRHGRPLVVPADPRRGRPRRCLVVPVSVEGEPQGWLLLAEHPSSLTAADERLARRAADYLGVELRVRGRAARALASQRAELARRLVRGTADPDEVRRAGERLGVDTNARWVVVHVDRPPRGLGGEDGDTVGAPVAHHLGTDVLATADPASTILLVAVPRSHPPMTAVAWVKAAIGAVASERWSDVDVAVGISSVCDARDLPRGSREARRVTQLAGAPSGCSGPSVLAADDLGPAWLLLADGTSGAGRRYAEDVLGALLGHRPGMPDLLRTLQVFLACGNKVRVAAVALGVHENTVRLRLDRIQQATGLDVVRDPRDQLTAQAAVLVLDQPAGVDRRTRGSRA